jgi:hypothetical protein
VEIIYLYGLSLAHSSGRAQPFAGLRLPWE